MPELATAIARLKSLLAEFEIRQKRVATDLSEPLSADFSEQAVEAEDDAGLEGEAALIAQEITSVKRARSRARDGTYGTCVPCGSAIGKARLEARPEAALCIGCARISEETAGHAGT